MLAPFPNEVLRFAQKAVTRRSTLPLATIPIEWEHHDRALRGTGAGNIIEFGAGHSLGQNIYLSPLVGRQTVVDLTRQADITEINRSIHALRRLHRISGGTVSSLDELKTRYRITYEAPVDISCAPYEDGAFDACVSTNTLEHIPRDSIVAILAELKRIIRPGGSMSACIDYSDHYSHTDPKIGPHNFLRFTEKAWRRHNHGRHFQNRLRHGHFLEIFRDTGWEVASVEGTQGPPLPDDVDAASLVHDGFDHWIRGRFLLHAAS